jgi:uncharacterized protein YndB with AHSA1/START domain
MMSVDPKGCARVSIETQAPASDAFAALVDRDRLARWFGQPDRPLIAGGRTDIAFGDGDFFAVEDIEITPPTRLRYVWRFLGLGGRNLITWTVSSGTPTVVTVTDEEPDRSDQEVAVMCEGWADYLDRLSRHLATGKNTRYDWRRDVDGGVELRLSPEQAAARLFAAEGLDRWQPWRASNWQDGASLLVGDAEQPAKLRLTGFERAPTALRMEVTAPSWRAPTRCEVALHPRRGGSMLSFSHTGWEKIDPRDDVQRRQRERFCRLWIASVVRARELVGV